jgi:hypothetical protein
MRIDNWESALAKYIADSQGLSFVWGRNDCTLWAAKWVDIATGSTFYNEWSELYNNEAEAQALIEANGKSSIKEMIDERLPPKAIPRISRGDVVMFNGAVGICDGLKSVFMQQSGLEYLHTLKCEYGWGV